MKLEVAPHKLETNMLYYQKEKATTPLQAITAMWECGASFSYIFKKLKIEIFR